MRRSGFFISLARFAGQEADNSIDVYIRDEHMDVLEDSGKRPLQRSLPVFTKETGMTKTLTGS